MSTKDALRTEINRAIQRNDDKEREARHAIKLAESEVKQLFKNVEYWVSSIDHVQVKTSHVNVTMELATGPETVLLEALEILVLKSKVSITPEANFSHSSPTYIIEGLAKPVRLSGTTQQGWTMVVAETGLPFEDPFCEPFLLSQLVLVAQKS